MMLFKLTAVGSFVLGLVVACAGSDDFEASASSGGAGSDAGTDSPGGREIGASCKAGAECASGFCADGFCCESACEGDCTSCGLTGSEGTCSPVAAGEKGECGGDGTCAGACDGNGACSFPDGATSCGTTSCSQGQQTGMICDGKGACESGSSDCGAFACGSDACLDECATSADCAADYHCDASGACVGKGSNGATCDVAGDCESGECVDGICCNVACAAPASCSTGSCVCGDATCGAGEACITWYADTDGDGFGDPNQTKPGCANTAPTGGKFVKNADDCYDKNVSAKPGQTAYFATQRGDGSFDYDCNGTGEKQYGSVLGLTCGPCGTKLGQVCVACGGSLGGPILYSNGYGCTKNNCSENKPFQGFKADVACGATGTMYTCSTTSCGSGENQSVAQQACR